MLGKVKSWPFPMIGAIITAIIKNAIITKYKPLFKKNLLGTNE